MLEIFNLDGDKLNIENSSRIGLGSYAANCVIASKKSIYVTTGDNENSGGGIYKIGMDNRQIEANMDLHDARWVDICNQDLFFVQLDAPVHAAAHVD